MKTKLIIGGIIALAFLIAGIKIGWWLHPECVSHAPVVVAGESEDFEFSGQAKPNIKPDNQVNVSENQHESGQNQDKGVSITGNTAYNVDSLVVVTAESVDMVFNQFPKSLTIAGKKVYESYTIPPKYKRKGNVVAKAKGTFNIYGGYDLDLSIQTDPDTVKFDEQIPPVKPRKEKSNIKTFSPVLQLSYAPFSKSVGVGCGIAIKRRIYFLIDVEAKKLDNAEVFGRVGLIF